MTNISENKIVKTDAPTALARPPLRGRTFITGENLPIHCQRRLLSVRDARARLAVRNGTEPTAQSSKF